MSESTAPPTGPVRERGSRRARRRMRLLLWTIGLIVLAAVIVTARPLYHYLKAKRAEQFAANAEALVKAGKWNDAAKQYQAAFQLDKLNYRALAGAARLASRANRPEAIDLWEQVVKSPGCTFQDRQEYAELLIRLDRLTLAEKIIDPLLKDHPDVKTLNLAARYCQKTGDKNKATEYARLAVKNAPDDDGARFELADILAQSSDRREQAEAHEVLWQIASRAGPYEKSAIEALARAPELSASEQKKILPLLEELHPKNITDDLLAADVRVQMQPDDAARIYDDEIDRWRDGTIDELTDLARWLNVHQQGERVLTLVPIERSLENNFLLLARLDALAGLQRWIDIDDTLTRPDLTLDPSVIESFRARTAQERGAVLDAEVHWNHAISLAGTDPGKLRFVANFAEQSRASASALKAYQQLARFPELARVAYEGAERVSQRMGDAGVQRSAAEKIVAAEPDNPNAADQLAYLNLLLNTNVESNFLVAKQLAERYPDRLAYRITAALGYLRQHDAGSALDQFKAPTPIDWKQTQPAWRAIYAAVLLANDRTDEARQMIETIPLERLSPAERELIQPKQ